MISLLLPTRRRRSEFLRFADSAFGTAARPAELEIVARTDDDDNTYDGIDLDRVTWLRGPRIVLSEMWNEAHRAAQGPIFGHMGDDIVFRTPGWDDIVRAAFDRHPDRVVFVHGDDMGNPAALTFGTHGFIHQVWTDTVGYFVPPYFSCDWNDTWLNDVANALGRRCFVDIKTEHLHFVHGKGPLDEVHRERLDRGTHDNVRAMYERLAPQRHHDIRLLQEVIDRGV